MGDAEFLLRLFTPHGEPAVTKEDFDGPHGAALRRWQEAGIVSREAAHFRAAGCPHCDAGVPHLLGGRYLCNVCRSEVDPDYLLLWTLDLRSLLGQVAGCLRLQGTVRGLVANLWQLGTGTAAELPVECFFCRRLPLAEPERERLRAYRRLIVFHGPFAPPDAGSYARWVPLAELLGTDGLPAPHELADLLRSRGRVRFDPRTGALHLGDAWLGEVPLWGREYFFLAALTARLDEYVPYNELKAEVLRCTGGSGDADEATFCQKLKSRIKAKYVPGIDRLIVVSHKGDGYRLRAEGEA